jgi:hypothetical protein
LISIVFTAIFIQAICRSYESATIVEKLTPRPIHSLPFPAITICPETKAQKTAVDFTDAYHYLHYNQSDATYGDDE